MSDSRACLSSGYELQRLDADDFAVEEPTSRRRRRGTLSRNLYANHFDHTDFWTPDSVAIPVEDSPQAVGL